MKVFSNFKGFTHKALIFSALIIAGIVGVSTNSIANAECSSNSVIYCGAGSISTVQNDYHNGVSGHDTASSIQHIYSYFGISSGDINSMGQSVAGEVYSDGTITVNGKVVATNAWTAGRQNISGSTKITYAGTTFYKRRPDVSFGSSPLSAFVVMGNGKFLFAILKSCGNPITATPKVPAPTPTPHHNACVNNACKQVSGSGKNSCTSNANCQPAHHNACVNNACVQVTGAGSNTCTSNANCQPAQHHSVCVQNACVSVPGAGYNTCSSNANCQPAQHHNVCQYNACVSVSGAGTSTCTSNANCQPKPAPTICTPTPQPPSNW